MYSTLDVLKLDKSIDVKDLQSQNMWFISLTSEVSKLETSRVRKEEQPENI